MTEVRFYHLETKPLERALPEILVKALEQKRRAVIKTPDSKSVKFLNDKLWTWQPDSFLPHGTEAEGHAEEQPVWITDKDENPNKADILILTGGASSDQVSAYSLCCEMLDGRNSDEVEGARARWKLYKEQDFEVTYWQQDQNGRWLKKA